MKVVLQNERQMPSRETIAFLKLFARNYKEVEFADGVFARMILK